MRVTLRDIAESLGLSTQAVSMAMRGHRRISSETRERVQQKAKEMGYHSDPALQSLIAYRSRSKSKGDETRWQRIALVYDWPHPGIWKHDPFAINIRESLQAIANTRGLIIEEFWLGERSAKADSVFRKIYNKGISGVIVAPPTPVIKPTVVTIPRSKFQVVTCGPEHLYTDQLTVQFDYYENFRLAWRVLRERGYQRIGLVYQRIHGWRTGQAWEGAYYVEKMGAGFLPQELPPFIVENEYEQSKPACLQWMREMQVDAIITSSYHVYEWAKEVNPEIFVAEMNPISPGRFGINLNFHEYCKTVLDILSVVMIHSLTSEQSYPYRVHVPGFWTEI